MRINYVVVVLVTLCTFDAVAESFLNFESGHVRPLALSPSKELLFAVNTPDNRLEIFRVATGLGGEVAGLDREGEVVVGLEPVAVAVRSESEVYVVNHLSDSVSCVDVSVPSKPYVKSTLLVGDEPRDVVIAGPSFDKVFVTTAHRGQNNPNDPELATPGVGRADLWVFDANNLAADPDVLAFFCDTPRALAATANGERVYLAAHLSGNQTTALTGPAVDPDNDVFIGDAFNAHGMPDPVVNVEGVPAPETGLILKFDGTNWVDSEGRDWSPRVRFNLPDKDVFIVDATQDPPVEIDSVSGVGTVIFNMAVHPVNGKVYVTNIDAQNDVRFEPEINGHVAENRVTMIDGTTPTPVHINPHIDYSTPSGPPEEIAASLAFPMGMVFTADGGTLYVAAFGSGKVAVLNDSAQVTDRIEVGGGPSGLALDEARNRLYVMNRFDQTIQLIDTGTRSTVATVALRYDPEPDVIRQGRPVLYDAINSGHGDSACASCHIFADLDGAVWDLGDPDGLVEDNPVQTLIPLSLRDFHPIKGPMTTQSLRGMLGAGPMHWRGDRNAVNSGAGSDVFDAGLAFMAFRPAFQSLLGMGTPLSEATMKSFRDFILTVVYPPNPIANIDDTLTPGQTAGRQVFESNGNRDGVGGDGVSCGTCHTLPLGTDGRGTFEGETQDFKVPHLRNLYQKVGMFGYAIPNIVSDSPFTLQAVPTPHLGDQVRGTGFLHDGSVPTLHNFFRAVFPEAVPFKFPDDVGRSGHQKVNELVAFLMTFDTGLAPVVGQQVTIDSSNATEATARVGVLRGRADAARCDLVAHGLVDGLVRGYFYTGGGVYQSDRRSETTTEAALITAVVGGAVVTFTAVYLGGGERIAIDRDEDGWFDRDELDHGGDPADPNVVPASFLPANCNGDGTIDISDAIVSLNILFGSGVASCVDACNANGDLVHDISDAIYTLNFLFANGSPPGSWPQCDLVGGDCTFPTCPTADS